MYLLTPATFLFLLISLTFFASTFEIFKKALTISDNVALYVPRNANVEQLVSLAGPNGYVEIEQHLVNKKLKTATAYYGELIDES